MSSFEVKVRAITVAPHPNADRLELGRVDDYQFIVAKGLYKTGDLGVYIPEQAVLPDWLIEEMEIRQYLAGPEKNRVKATRLRGVLSQGIFYRPNDIAAGKALINGVFYTWHEGEELSHAVEVKKYEPEIPKHLAGKVRTWGTPNGIFRTYTDIENIKKHPEALREGEPVVITEKLHGTCCIFALIKGEFYVSSKGIAARYLTLEDEPGNVYWHIAHQFDIAAKLSQVANFLETDQIILFGEGLGVQDLMYGLKPGQFDFFAFDLMTGDGFLTYNEFIFICQIFKMATVPVLYKGEFSKEVVAEYTSGQSTLMNAAHIREGVVIRPQPERFDTRTGRLILKSISPDYLTRKGEATEFN